jgi:S1-C subfamily serine protease
MARAALLMLLLLASCTPTPDTGLRLVTLDSDTGLSLRELPPQALRAIGLTYGLAVVKTGGLAERAGLKIGDVVYGINQERVNNLEEFNRLLAQQPGGRLGLLVRRGQSDFYVAVDLTNGAAPKGLPPAARDTLLRT